MAPTTEDNANAKEDMAVPYELLELIVEEYWASPLSRKERIAFMTMSQLISTQWACAFDSISLRDVYIPCVPYLYHYRSVLSRKAPTPKPHESLPARNACRTLTFQRPHLDTGATSLYQSVSKKAVAHLMDTLYAIPRLPNLRHLYLEYFFVTLDGESQKCQAFPFPLIPLDVKYSFEPSVPSGLIRAMGATGDPLSSPWSPPTIRTVSVWESVHKDAAVDVLLACSRLEQLRVPGVYTEKLSSYGGANHQFIFHLPVPELSMFNLKENRRNKTCVVKAKTLGICLESLFPLVPNQPSTRTQISSLTRRKVLFFRRLGAA